jgi:hypothetical protein
MLSFMPKNQKDAETQTERFIETARSLARDDDKERFQKNLGKMASAKPASAAKRPGPRKA